MSANVLHSAHTAEALSAYNHPKRIAPPGPNTRGWTAGVLLTNMSEEMEPRSCTADRKGVRTRSTIHMSRPVRGWRTHLLNAGAGLHAAWPRQAARSSAGSIGAAEHRFDEPRRKRSTTGCIMDLPPPAPPRDLPASAATPPTSTHLNTDYLLLKAQGTEAFKQVRRRGKRSLGTELSKVIP